MPRYIDVRGVWPILFIGLRCYTLEGCDRNITVNEAIILVFGDVWNI
jgi:hypothetical protein